MIFRYKIVINDLKQRYKEYNYNMTYKFDHQLWNNQVEIYW